VDIQCFICGHVRPLCGYRGLLCGNPGLFRISAKEAYMCMNICEHIEIPSKILDYFLHSNKSNINELHVDRSPALTSCINLNWHRTSCTRPQNTDVLRNASVLQLTLIVLATLGMPHPNHSYRIKDQCDMPLGIIQQSELTTDHYPDSKHW